MIWMYSCRRVLNEFEIQFYCCIYHAVQWAVVAEVLFNINKSWKSWYKTENLSDAFPKRLTAVIRELFKLIITNHDLRRPNEFHRYLFVHPSSLYILCTTCGDNGKWWMANGGVSGANCCQNRCCVVFFMKDINIDSKQLTLKKLSCGRQKEHYD